MKILVSANFFCDIRLGSSGDSSFSAAQVSLCFTISSSILVSAKMLGLGPSALNRWILECQAKTSIQAQVAPQS